MRKFFVIAILIAVSLYVNGLQVANAGSTLRIINNTNENVIAIYCSRNAGVWGRDRLGNDILRPGESFTIRSAPVTTDRYVSVRVNFSGGRYRYWENLDLNRVSVVRIR